MKKIISILSIILVLGSCKETLIESEISKQNAIPKRVSGYTILQFQAALLSTGSWGGVRDYLKNNYDNPTENFLDELFTEW